MLNLSNHDYLEQLLLKRERIVSSGARARAQSWLDGLGAHLYIALPQPILVDADDYQALVTAANCLLGAQLKVIRHYLAQHSRERLLDEFGVTADMARFIDWQKLASGAMTVARMDIVPTAAGYQFCEFNVHSAVGGAESYGCYSRFCDALQIAVDQRARSPAYDLAMLYARIVEARGLERVVILDSSAHAGLGYPRQEDLVDFLQKALPRCMVVAHSEVSYPVEWLTPETGAKTLVHRVFTYDEMTDGGVFFKRLWDSGATITNTFEAELRMSKRWLALLCDPHYQSCLTDQERAVIREYLPHTFVLDDDNLQDALRDKNDYVFKYNQSYGGEGVFIGATTATGVLAAEIRRRGTAQWVCQKWVDAETLRLPYDDSIATADHAMVLGLYLFDGQPNGFFTRGSSTSRVVNLSSGAGKMSWGLVVDDAGRETLIDQLRAL